MDHKGLGIVDNLGGGGGVEGVWPEGSEETGEDRFDLGHIKDWMNLETGRESETD